MRMYSRVLRTPGHEIRFPGPETSLGAADTIVRATELAGHLPSGGKNEWHWSAILPASPQQPGWDMG
jgi:hypothetical protein